MHVKTPKVKKSVKVADGANVKEVRSIKASMPMLMPILTSLSLFQLKQKISSEFDNTPLEQLCLIFAGKILKDHETIAQHNIKDGMTVHLVIKSAPSASPAPSNAAASSSSTSAPSSAGQQQQQQPRPSKTRSCSAAFLALNASIPTDPANTPFGLGGMGGLAGLGDLGMGSANFMEMQQRMQSEMLNNPDMLRSILDSPLTQNLMSNPEIIRSLISSNPQMQNVRKIQ